MGKMEYGVDSSANESRISVEYLSPKISVKTQERRGLRLGNWWLGLIPKTTDIWPKFRPKSTHAGCERWGILASCDFVIH